MAIFGKAVVLNGSEETVLREGNGWDVFLNYFFGGFFIVCFAFGIVLNPFIIAYHTQQKKTFAKFMFLLVSSIDQFKLIYFPLVLVPKLLSPLEDKDYYIIYNPTSVPWTAYLHCYFMIVVWFELDVLVILSVSRYFSIAYSFSCSQKKNIALFVTLLLSFFKWIIIAMVTSVRLYQKTAFFSRISDSYGFATHDELTFTYIIGSSTCLFLIIGVIFVILTIHHMRNTDTASSEISSKNISRGIIFLIVQSFLNIFVLFLTFSYTTTVHLKMFALYSDTRIYSTGLDLFQFAVLYGTPVSQSFFNSISFLFISRSFRKFLTKFVDFP